MSLLRRQESSRELALEKNRAVKNYVECLWTIICNHVYVDVVPGLLIPTAASDAKTLLTLPRHKKYYAYVNRCYTYTYTHMLTQIHMFKKEP